MIEGMIPNFLVEMQSLPIRFDQCATLPHKNYKKVTFKELVQFFRPVLVVLVVSAVPDERALDVALWGHRSEPKACRKTATALVTTRPEFLLLAHFTATHFQYKKENIGYFYLLNIFDR